MPRPINPRCPDAERLAALAAQGMSDREIAALCGVTYSCIARARRRGGIRTGRPPGRQWPSRIAAHLAERAAEEAEEIEGRLYRRVLAIADDGWAARLAGRAYTDATTLPTVAHRGDGPATRLPREARS